MHEAVWLLIERGRTLYTAGVIDLILETMDAARNSLDIRRDISCPCRGSDDLEAI